jgi:hypothetical protein
VHVYLYREGAVSCASVYVLTPGYGPPSEPLERIEAENDDDAEARARAFVDRRFPKG